MRAQLASEIKAVNDQICNGVIYVLISIYPLSSTTTEGATRYEQVHEDLRHMVSQARGICH